MLPAGEPGRGASPDLSSVVALLPTPAARDGERGPDYAAAGRSSTGDYLETAVSKMLPTPQGRDGEHTRGADPERYKGSKSQGGRRSNLDDMVAAARVGKFLPTPTAGDAKSSGSRNTPDSKAHPGVSLTDAVTTGNSKGRMLPTPSAADGMGGHESRGGTRGHELLLGGTAKALSRGEPTNPPSDATSSSSAAQPLTLWTDEAG